MNRKFLLPVLGAFLMAFFSSFAHSEAAIRFNCDNEAKGAKIFINGDFKATCPADAVFVKEGDKKVRVVKADGEDYERVYETEFFIGDNTAKRVTVTLSGRKLTQEAISRRAAEQRQIEREAAASALKKAQDGAVIAMREVAGYYQRGTGVERSSEKANYWYDQADAAEERLEAEKFLMSAEAGSVSSMREMTKRYETGQGVEQSSEKASEWRKKADAIEARRAIKAAEFGKIEAMEQLSQLYKDGKGLDQSDEQAKYWADKAEAQRQKERKQERDRQLAASAEAKRAATQEKIDDINFFASTKKRIEEVRADTNPNDLFELSTGFVTMPVSVAIGFVSDTALAPTKSTDLIELRNEMESRPSRFDNPDSMIAQAYRAQNNQAD